MYLKQLTIKGQKYWYLFHTFRKAASFVKKSKYLGKKLPSQKDLDVIKAAWHEELFPRKIKKVFVVYMQPSSEIERATLSITEQLLKKYGFTYTLCERNAVKELPLNTDLVIVIGGDGTFLRIAHYIKEEFILGINSSPQKKEGFHLPYTKDTFEESLTHIVKNRFNYCSLLRLEATINKYTHTEYALNEIFIGHKKPYKMTRLVVTVHGKTHMIKSSGLVIGTPAGYRAWLKSMGGKKMPLHTQKYQYVIREPYEGRLHQHITTREILSTHETINVSSLTPEAIVVVDSLSKEYAFPLGSSIKIKAAHHPLKYICPIW